MNKDQTTYGIAGLVVGIALIWVLMGTGVFGQRYGMMANRGNNGAPANMNNIDRHFIEQMIPHHDGAIVMANLAMQNAEHQEIKTLSQNIIKSQSEEISQMKAWYKTWFGADVPALYSSPPGGMHAMHGGMMDSTTDVSNLENAKPFDKEFIEQMIPHHQMAVMMAQMLKNPTNRPEMLKLANDIINAQNSEIQQMQTWYSQWYK